jgi:hypothetical protein
MQTNIFTKKLKSALAFGAFGVMLAQGLVLVSSTTAKAQEELEIAPENGGCTSHKGDICGLNGHNYSDKQYYN